MKDEKEWSKLIRGGTNALDGFRNDLKELNRLHGTRSLTRFLEEQTKGFLVLVAEYFGCNVKSSRKKRVFVIAIKNVISNDVD